MSNKNLSYFWIKLPEQNKVYFWSIFSTGLVGFFSLWLGITIQDDINTKNARETQKLARYQMVQAVFPNFSQYIDTSGIVFFDLWEIYNSTRVDDEYKSRYMSEVRLYYENNQQDFIEAMKNSVNFMCDNRYYFNKSSQKQICSNNTCILFGLRMLERNNDFLFYTLSHWNHYRNLNDSVAAQLNDAYYAKNVFSYWDNTVDNISDKYHSAFIGKKTCDTSLNDTLSYIETTLYNFVFLPYIDNFNVYQKELLPEEDVQNNVWKHILVLLACVVFSLCFCLFVLKHVFKAKTSAVSLYED